MARLWVTRCLDCPLWVNGDHDDDGDRFCDHPCVSAEHKDIELNAELQEGRYQFPLWCNLHHDSVQLLVPSQLRRRLTAVERNGVKRTRSNVPDREQKSDEVQVQGVLKPA